MVTKKIQKSGNSYFVYLPLKWVKSIGSNEVELSISKTGTLEIFPVGAKQIASLKKEIVLDTKDTDLIIRAIASLYVDGYDEFTIRFKSKLEKDIYSKLIRELISRGLSQYLVDSSEEYFYFKIPFGFLSPIDLGKLLLNKILKAIISIENNQKDLAADYRKEYITATLRFQRLYNSVLQKPFILKDLKMSSVELLNLLFVLYFSKEIGEIIINEKINKQDILISKKLIELLLTFLNNRDFEKIKEISKIKRKVKHKTLFVFFKIIERTLLNWKLL
ncbi:MAG: hypothetical protein J7K22_03405 [Nanoarchaeota archaeon]|nr:hypothetical protein [Nanoarchaeota archaeon]